MATIVLSIPVFQKVESCTSCLHAHVCVQACLNYCINMLHVSTIINHRGVPSYLFRKKLSFSLQHKNRCWSSHPCTTCSPCVCAPVQHLSSKRQFLWTPPVYSNSHDVGCCCLGRGSVILDKLCQRLLSNSKCL